MGSVDRIVKFNAQTAGRERLIRLFQYLVKFARSTLHIYYTRYAKGGTRILEIIYKLRDMEQYLLSCRRLVNFGRCSDQFYSAVRSLQLFDPVDRTTLSTSKFWSSLQMLADHALLLQQLDFMRIDKQLWIDRSNRFWLYSVSVNLLRDAYELICVIQQRKTRAKSNLYSGLVNFSLASPIQWAREYPKLSCDLIKNACDFWIPYSSVNKLEFHPTLIALLGIISSVMGILQIYSDKYRLSPS